jgi:hypothetical protein
MSAPQHRQNDGTCWLATLIESFERISGPGGKDPCCDAALMQQVRAHLARDTRRQSAGKEAETSDV